MTANCWPVRNPATGDEIVSIASVGADETRRAIEAAATAMQMEAAPAKTRAQLLRSWFELIMANQEDLALLMTAEQGKPLAESRGEVAYGASYVEWFGEQAKRINGDVIPGPGPTSASSASSSPWGLSPPSRPGTSPSR
jgi:succinate-semialdehyde dehydrogenase/glutarate-semialdehyde dehydrogenase